jgi:hypothetical protein
VAPVLNLGTYGTVHYCTLRTLFVIMVPMLAMLAMEYVFVL